VNNTLLLHMLAYDNFVVLQYRPPPPLSVFYAHVEFCARHIKKMAACFGAWQITTRTCFLLHKSLVCTQPQPAIQAAICHHGVSGVKADLKKNVATVRMRDAGGIADKGSSQMSQNLSPPAQQPKAVPPSSRICNAFINKWRNNGASKEMQ
jgi:hypothetical protein